MSEQEVLTVVQQWAAAELAGDVEALRTLLTPDFVGIGPVGFVLTAQQWAGRHHGDMHNDEFTVVEPHIRRYGETAVVEAELRQRTTAMGRDTSGSFRLGLVAVRVDGQWLIANLQLSGPLTAPGETPAFAR